MSRMLIKFPTRCYFQRVNSRNGYRVMATEREEFEIDSGVGGAAASSFQNSQKGSSTDPSFILQEEDILDGVGGAAASSFQNSQTGSSTDQPILREEDIPGALLNGREPSQLHVVELKRWLKCRGATTSGRKQDLVKRLVKSI